MGHFSIHGRLTEKFNKLTSIEQGFVVSWMSIIKKFIEI